MNCFAFEYTLENCYLHFQLEHLIQSTFELPKDVENLKKTVSHLESFEMIQNPENHLEILENGKMTHPCKICEKEFSSKWNLTVHLRIHNVNNPFVCPYCDYRSNQYGIQYHCMKKHGLKIETESMKADHKIE